MKEDFVDVLHFFLDTRLENIHTVLPGKFIKYEGHNTRKASVKPLIKLKTKGGEDVEIPVIDNVPVIFPSSSSFNLLFPIKKNDGCLVIFSETGIGNYLAGLGIIDVEADDLERFSLTDAICIPGLWTFRNTPKIQLNNIELTDAGELIFLSGTESYVKGDVLKTELQKNIDALTQLQTDFTNWTPASGDGGAALKTLLSSGFLTKTLASLTNILSLLIKGK